MYSLVTYKQSGVWPKNTPNEVNTNELQKIVSENHTEEAQKSFELAQKTISKFISDDGNNFIDFITGIFDKYNIGSFTPPRPPPGVAGTARGGGILLNFFRPNEVEGYLDDLIGQQLLIQILLLVVVISLILLFSVYLFTQVMLNNREFILKKFNNKFIKFYIKYHLILARISSFVLPALIMFGLIELLVGTIFILTNPIPYEKIPIDLHIYIKK